MKAQIIENFEQLLKLTFDNNDNVLYRGQSLEYCELVPGIFREQVKNYIKKEHGNPETAALMYFKRCVSTLESAISTPNTAEDWMFLAQHNGIPTRLLDWTSNILKALFFAVIDNPSNNGEIYILNIKKLNELSNAAEIFDTTNEKKYEFLINDAFALQDKDKTKLKNDLKLNNETIYPLSIIPYFIRNKRMENQEGTFTIHPPEFSDLYNLTDDFPEIIERYIIPHHLKRDFEKKTSKTGYRLFYTISRFRRCISKSEKIVDIKLKFRKSILFYNKFLHLIKKTCNMRVFFILKFSLIIDNRMQIRR